MFGGKSSAVVQSSRFIHLQVPLAKVTISPFALWSAHAGWIVTSTIVGLIFTIHVMGLFVVQGNYPDPFTRYDPILPGNPIQALSAYPCSMSQTRINGEVIPGSFSCIIFPHDGFFDTIHIEGRNNEITEMTFYAIRVRLGELALHWKPAVRPQSNGTMIAWDSDDYSIAVINSEVDYQVPIRIFSIKGF